MFNENISNYDDKLVLAMQKDYLANASNYRLAKEIPARTGVVVAVYRYLLSFIG